MKSKKLTQDDRLNIYQAALVKAVGFNEAYELYNKTKEEYCKLKEILNEA